jgi:hypothetical protein
LSQSTRRQAATVERLAATPLIFYDAARTHTRATTPKGLSTASFSPALYDTFAIVTRRGARLSPGVRELLRDVEAHMRAVADELDRSR